MEPDDKRRRRNPLDAADDVVLVVGWEQRNQRLQRLARSCGDDVGTNAAAHPRTHKQR
jgi:hypothetical protein